eukprot:15338764-Alexandrium_andersonii.AAC.1
MRTFSLQRTVYSSHWKWPNDPVRTAPGTTPGSVYTKTRLRRALLQQARKIERSPGSLSGAAAQGQA